MHDLEPFDRWTAQYSAALDPRSPYYGTKYHPTLCTHTIYNYYIHPQWDTIESSTLYVKVLWCDYDTHFVIIELLGEWNDILHNDIMLLKRNLIDLLLEQGIQKFLLLGENIMDFHADTDDYYQEWWDELEDGWVVGLNFRAHVAEEFKSARLTKYIWLEGGFGTVNWRKLTPIMLQQVIETLLSKYLNY